MSLKLIMHVTIFHCVHTVSQTYFTMEHFYYKALCETCYMKTILKNSGLATRGKQRKFGVPTRESEWGKSDAFLKALMSQIFYGAQILCSQLAYFMIFFMDKVDGGIYTPLSIRKGAKENQKDM